MRFSRKAGAVNTIDERDLGISKGLGIARGTSRRNSPAAIEAASGPGVGSSLSARGTDGEASTLNNNQENDLRSAILYFEFAVFYTAFLVLYFLVGELTGHWQTGLPV
jgi:hypothetical protein